MKSYSNNLSRILKAILSDIERIFPTTSKGLRADFVRILLATDHRGIAVYTLDLPALGKHFDKCLSGEAYTNPCIALSSTRHDSKVIPKLFGDLLLRVFDRNGQMLVEPCISAIASLRQLYVFAKKVKIQCKERNTYEGVRDFFTHDGSLPLPDLNWEAVDSSFGSYSDRPRLTMLSYRLPELRAPSKIGDSGETMCELTTACQQVADILSRSLGSFDPDDWLTKHGTGSVSNFRRYASKYELTTWNDKLEQVFPMARFAFANYDHWVDYVSTVVVEYAPVPSKLVQVPKTQKGPRLISVESAEHQRCQQAIWRYFDKRVEGCWIGKFIHFRDQTYNQRAALEASKTGSSWTVDLSSASDLLSCRFVERMFDRNRTLLQALQATRTSTVVQSIDANSPSSLPLRKFATMGNACTFPVESLAFLVISIASVLLTRRMIVNYPNIQRLAGSVHVFGDDIIIPSDAGPYLLEMLSHFNFKVNADKSCTSGTFRESCGLEAFKGHDVTPAYWLQPAIGRTPESIVSTVESSNNFFLKGWWLTAESIQSTINGCIILPKNVGSGALGFVSFSKGTHFNKNKRWNKDLQRYEIRCDFLMNVARKKPECSMFAFLQFLEERPGPYDNWTSGTMQKPRLKLKRGWVSIHEFD